MAQSPPGSRERPGRESPAQCQTRGGPRERIRRRCVWRPEGRRGTRASARTRAASREGPAERRGSAWRRSPSDRPRSGSGRSRRRGSGPPRSGRAGRPRSRAGPARRRSACSDSARLSRVLRPLIFRGTHRRTRRQPSPVRRSNAPGAGPGGHDRRGPTPQDRLVSVAPALQQGLHLADEEERPGDDDRRPGAVRPGEAAGQGESAGDPGLTARAAGRPPDSPCDLLRAPWPARARAA